MTTLPTTQTNYQQLAMADASAAGIDPAIFVAQIQQESGFNPNAISPAGAIGIAQFMPATAAGLGLNPRDPVASLKAAAQYDARNLQAYGGDYQKMLAAYNAGGGAVNSAVASHGSTWLSFMPAETQNYVKSILAGRTPTPSVSGTENIASGFFNASGLVSTVTTWGEYVAIFLLAIVLIAIGFFLLAEKQAVGLVKAAVK